VAGNFIAFSLFFAFHVHFGFILTESTVAGAESYTLDVHISTFAKALGLEASSVRLQTVGALVAFEI
jgi:hypothetical protein